MAKSKVSPQEEYEPGPDQFLLYIDILGFANMALQKPSRVENVYQIIDSLNVHHHFAFKTIVFSDTILVYNVDFNKTDEDRRYLVNYMIEFADDLQHRLVGQDVFFRAVITAGTFKHYRLEHTECFYGSALIDAYNREKEIPSLGLFIDRRCTKYVSYYPLITFDAKQSFVYLNRSFDKFCEIISNTLPLRPSGKLGLDFLSDMVPHVPWMVEFLRAVYENACNHPSPMVRVKFLTAWSLYHKRWGLAMDALKGNNFVLTALADPDPWGECSAVMQREVKYFKRLKNHNKGK